MTMIWPEVFTNKDFSYKGTNDEVYASALADGLVGWANCSFEKPPAPTFGVGMVKIRGIIGANHPEEISKLSDEFLKERRTE